MNESIAIPPCAPFDRRDAIHPARATCEWRRTRASTLARASIALAALLLLSACSLLGGRKDAPTIYAPQPVVPADPAWPRLDSQLVVAAVQSARPVDSLRISVRPAPQEMQVYKGAQWAQRPSEMLERAVLRTLEDSGKVRAVARAGAGVGGEHRLVLDIRRFESDYAGGARPSAVIEVSAKLLDAQERDVVASRTFLRSEPASGTGVPQVIEAFERGLGAVTRDIAGWTLGGGRDTGRGAGR